MNETPLRRVAIGGDHAGFHMKQMVVDLVGKAGLEVCDCGTFDEQPCDFPDVAEKVAQKLLAGAADRGILVCGSGVGVSVAANKFPGIRASLCHDTYSAHQGVEHDDMNVLCIGARVIGPALAAEIVESFLRARYAPQPRHAARVEKIAQIEKRVINGQFGRSTPQE
ncbi:MAG: ribose-5-phosphate isomerase [Pirellulaceae bacterium]|nr:MAG: ribose-5-phosphate isomerase [Pirellulaceae bacterium]